MDIRILIRISINTMPIHNTALTIWHLFTWHKPLIIMKLTREKEWGGPCWQLKLRQMGTFGVCITEWGPSLVGSLGSSYRYKRFLSCLDCYSQPSTKYFFPQRTFFLFMVWFPIAQQPVVPGRLSLNTVYVSDSDSCPCLYRHAWFMHSLCITLCYFLTLSCKIYFLWVNFAVVGWMFMCCSKSSYLQAWQRMGSLAVMQDANSAFLWAPDWRGNIVCARFSWARTFKCLWGPGIDAKEWIPPAYVVWRAGTKTLFLLNA